MFDLAENRFDLDVALNSQDFALLRKQVGSGLISETPQAEAYAHMAVVLGSGAFGFEWTGVAPISFIVA